MKKLPAFILLALFPSLAHGSVVIEISTFPKSPDLVVQRCYERAMAANRKPALLKLKEKRAADRAQADDE